MHLFERLKDIAEGIRCLIRGSKGLPLEDDVYSGLINVRDPKERTRLSEALVYSHSAMQLIAKMYPEEMGFWKDIAETEDTYFISLDGLQRQEMILMQKAKSTQGVQVTTGGPSLETQKMDLKPLGEEPKPEKKGILHR